MANTEQSSDFKPFKFRELKVYSSTEYLANNHKKYRQVFERQDTNYIYAEVSLYNKLFDTEEWSAQVELRCYLVKREKKEVCRLTVTKEVSRFDNVVYIREGWGNPKPGVFWKRGTYFWEVYVNGEKIGYKYFYIIEADHEIEFDHNPYLKIESLRLYEGPYDDVNQDDRLYYRHFSKEETRYIYVELTLRNLQPSRAWHLELFTKFYNDAREAKGQVVRLLQIERKQELIHISAGWGATIQGLWRKDTYRADIIFMDQLLVSIPFRVQDEFEEGLPAVFLPFQYHPLVIAPVSEQQSSFGTVMGQLDALVGLQAIKTQVRHHATYLQFLQLRRERGFREQTAVNVHSVFIGNPGTGKTTVAAMMGQLYKQMGLLSKGHVHTVDRVDLVGEYIGQTAPKAREAIDKARGGVLFIDEAYALARSNDDGKDFGREVIEILVKEMSTSAGDLAVIVAGYPREMEHFLNSNPGLKSRFKHFYEFRDYLPQELAQIVSYAVDQKDVQLTQEARTRLNEMITDAYRKRDRTFGNARYVHDLVEQAKIQLGLRIMQANQPHQLERSVLSTVTLDDVLAITDDHRLELPSIPVDEAALQAALSDLNRLVGMRQVKEEICQLVDLVRYYRESGRDVLNSFFLHTVFVGNPGTGKTTVARVLARLYRALGVLERGHIVETDRQGLVAGYVGQTAQKTSERIDEALGGVLFIDEAYALSQSTGSRGDFGDEAIQTLLKRMEDQRGRFFVFVAGYPDNMDAFLKANPGLSSRFDKQLRFDDYDATEMLQIAELMIHEEGLTLSDDALSYLRRYLVFLHHYRDKYFGNARAIRAIVEEIARRHYVRLSSIPLAERAAQANHLLLADLAHLEMNPARLSLRSGGIGFR